MIDAQLQRLWNEELGKNRTRACFFTLLLYTRKGEKEEAVQKLLQKVLSKLPCRVLWVQETPGEEDTLHTAVRTVAISEEIFCEIIEIQADAKSLARVPYIILPHLLPDLPLYLLWTEDPTTDATLFPAFEKYAQKVIFDVSPIDDVQQYARTMHKVFLLEKSAVSDIHWSSLKGWRHLLHTTFDGAEEIAHLTEIKSLNIYYSENSPIRAAYLQAWLASCLQWKFETIEHQVDAHMLRYRTPAGAITVSLFPQQSNLPSGVILGVEIECAHEGNHYVFKRQPRARQVFIQHSNIHTCDLPYCHYLPGIEEGKEIIEEIFYQQIKEKHYKNTLELMAQIPWQKK